MYAREYGMKIAVLRQTGVWMPGDTDGYKPKDKKGADESCAKYWWTYVDARDVARAFRAALEAPNLPSYGHYFLAEKDTMIDIPTMEAIKKHWPKVKVRKEIPGFGSVLSIEAAKKAFGWEPIHSWRDK
jgi:nucleoside-diphosphate-sugar epimerase